MSRPDAQSVIDLTRTKLDVAVVDAIIDDAQILAAKCLDGASEELQEAALKWLSAHLVASTQGSGMEASRSLGDASKSFVRATVGDGIRGTIYGQQAIALLPCLARLGRAQATITVI